MLYGQQPLKEDLNFDNLITYIITASICLLRKHLHSNETNEHICIKVHKVEMRVFGFNT